MPIAPFLAQAIVRYCVSGSLIVIYMAAEAGLRRRYPVPARVAAPRWTHALVALSLLAYYALIGPTGGPLLGGAGNVAGLGLAGLAIAVRASRRIRHPDLASRSLFYVALPLAVGVPWGLLVLSLPACAASVWACARAERRAAIGSAALSARVRYRMVPGIW